MISTNVYNSIERIINISTIDVISIDKVPVLELLPVLFSNDNHSSLDLRNISIIAKQQDAIRPILGSNLRKLTK